MNDRALLDRVALTDLVMRYCRGIDRRDFALVRSLYHDDATDDHGMMFQGSADDYVAWLPGTLNAFDCTIHSITNSLFVVDGDVAEGEHNVQAFHRTKAPERQELTIFGRYLDRYERRDGLWKFAHRQLVFDHSYARRVDESGVDAARQDAPNGSADRSDPSWSMPLLARLAGDPGQ
ncbi:MAG: nuclear transport factor 2 family protein [Sphingorhabdus sp.]